MTKSGLRLSGVVVFAAVIVVLVYEHRLLVGLRAENQSLREQLERLAASVASPTSAVVPASDSRPLSEEQLRELLRLRGEVTLLRRQQDELLQRLAAQSKPAPERSVETERAWVQEILKRPPKDQGAAAGALRGKLLRREMTNIAPAELLLQEELLKGRLNETLERSPNDFADFQTGFIQATLGMADEAKAQQIHDLILETYRQAVANGLDIPSKPAVGAEEWVERRFQLDRAATGQLQQMLTPEERSHFDRAFLGVMGVDLGGVGVDKSNYPKRFLGGE
jgi:hypothetical protein